MSRFNEYVSDGEYLLGIPTINESIPPSIYIKIMKYHFRGLSLKEKIIRILYYMVINSL